MANLLKNKSDSIPECNSENKSLIDDRITQSNVGIPLIRAEIMELDNAVQASSDSKIRNIKKATSFPLSDIFAMLANNPGCMYLRVYNGLNSDGEFVTYMAPISDAFDTYVAEDSSDQSIISKSCCHCNPCSRDKILNP